MEAARPGGVVRVVRVVRVVGLVAAVAAVLVAAGCSRSGKGTNVGTQFPTAVLTGPSGPAGANPSGAAPGSGGLPTTSAAPAPSSVPAGPVSFTDAAGHFRATFPAAPVASTQHRTVHQVNVTVHIAQVNTGAGRTAVVEEDLPEAIPDVQAQSWLHDAVQTAVPGASVHGEAASTFQGHPARQATLSTNGDTESLVVVLDDGTRLYYLLAPAGGTFTTLTASFRTL